MPVAPHRTGPRLSDDVTRRISAAVFAELAERGYASLSIDGVARQAGVGKAAIYRRWAGKREMVVALVSAQTSEAEYFPDTGSLRGDLIEWMSIARRQLSDPTIARLSAEMVALTAREEEMAQTLFARIGAIRRARGQALLRRAIERGELPEEIDLELAADVVPGPLYWRLAVARRPVDDAQLETLVDMVIGALQARQLGPLRARAPARSSSRP